MGWQRPPGIRNGNKRKGKKKTPYPEKFAFAGIAAMLVKKTIRGPEERRKRKKGETKNTELNSSAIKMTNATR